MYRRKMKKAKLVGCSRFALYSILVFCVIWIFFLNVNVRALLH